MHGVVPIAGEYGASLPRYADLALLINPFRLAPMPCRG